MADPTPQLQTAPVSLSEGGPQGLWGTHQHSASLPCPLPIPMSCELHLSLTPPEAMRCQRTSSPSPSPFHKPPPEGHHNCSTGWLFQGQALARPLFASSSFVE